MGSRRTSHGLAPDPLRPDVGALTAHVQDMVARGQIAALITWVLSFIQALWKIQTELTEQLRNKTSKHAPSERLRALKRMLAGTFEAAANDDASSPDSEPERKRKPRKRDKHGRPKLPDHLPRETQPAVLVEPARRQCRKCQASMCSMGFETIETLETKTTYSVKVTQREKLSCPECRSCIEVAHAPDQVVDRGILGDSLLIGAMVDHFGNAVSLERIARDAREQGAPVCANTLGRSLGKLVDLFDPIVRHIFQRCVGSLVLGIDATSMPVLDPKVPAGIRRSTLWNLLGDDRFSYFSFARTGHDTHLAALLEGCSLGALIGDGSPTLNVAEARARSRAGCHSHARSKLVAALRGGDARAVPALLIYAELFAIEARCARGSLEERLCARQTESQSVLARLWAWTDARSGEVEPASVLGKALKYLTRQRKRLEVFLTNPRVALTNNAVERELRTWVLDRKTWMFCGHDKSAGRTAAALTIIMTCRRLGLDVRRYLRDTLRRLLDGEKNASSLWPENYVPSG